MSTVKLNHSEITAAMQQRKLESDINKIIIRKTTTVIDYTCAIFNGAFAVFTLIDLACGCIYDRSWSSPRTPKWNFAHHMKKFTGVVAAMITAAAWTIKPILRRLPTRPSEIILDSPGCGYEIVD
ncbi:hypothetical protein F-liban_340 [Faustovirus]|nr:hypothetical protein F-liban_340 [Faustovirus]SME65027.1 Hypothetical protein FSTVST1_330 [Faustovirus ST1]